MAAPVPLKQPRPLNEIPNLHATSLRDFEHPATNSKLPDGAAAADTAPRTQQDQQASPYDATYSVPHFSEVPQEIQTHGAEGHGSGPMMELDHARTHQTNTPPPVVTADGLDVPPPPKPSKPAAPPKRSGFFGKVIECFRPTSLFGDEPESTRGQSAASTAEAKPTGSNSQQAPQDAPLEDQVTNSQQSPSDAPLQNQVTDSQKTPHDAPLQDQIKTMPSSNGQGARQQTRRKWWMNSKTPLEQLPQPWTWEAYYDALNNQEMDANDPPQTPGYATAASGTTSARAPRVPDSVDGESLRTAPDDDNLSKQAADSDHASEPSTPYERKMLAAPVGYSDRDRQGAVHRLDVFGRSGPPTLASVKAAQSRSSDIHVTPEEQEIPITDADLEPSRPEDMLSMTLEGHDQFKKLVRYARRAFGTPLSMISVVDDDKLLYLAETGLGLSETPRDINFCGWTLLSSAEGFSINDTHKDWRFINNPLVTNYGARFYAGCPIFAPELYPGQEVQAVGTICVCDMMPREFTSDDRKKLMRLADLVRKEIATWHQERLASKMRLLNTRLSTFHHRVGSLHDASRSRLSLATSYEADPAELTAWGPDDLDSIETSSNISEEGTDATAARIFALATRTIARTLDLRLTYLIEVQFDHRFKNKTTGMTLLSSHGLPDPPPVFDDKLHLKALRTPEGGLLYQNPLATELPEGESLPRSASSEDTQYSSAILVRVLETESSGFVLAGFADAERATFGMEDLDFIRRVATEIRPFCRSGGPGLPLPLPVSSTSATVN